eukprot:c33840_g1_i1.p1 GENE.c33840_g1_i1~~c33840_g1_i1.p1  ORF type:complete len:373 (+),score=90.14 c33840_g1_i1:1-1119(+)
MIIKYINEAKNKEIDGFVKSVELIDSDHFDIVNPNHKCWDLIWESINQFLNKLNENQQINKKYNSNLNKQQVDKKVITTNSNTITTNSLVNSKDIILDMLSRYQTVKLPEPGAPIHFDIHQDANPKHVRFTVPQNDIDQSLLGFWTCSVLFRHLSVQNILTILNLILIEECMVFVSSNVGILCGVVLSLVQLMKPFIWEGMLIPLLPDNLNSFLEAPIPFIVGTLAVPYSLKSRDDVTIINIDKNTIQFSKAPYPRLPQFDYLKTHLSPLASKLMASYNQFSFLHVTSNIQDAIAKDILTLLHGYLNWLTFPLKTCSITDLNKHDNNPNTILLKVAYVNSFTEHDRNFILQMIETQLFSTRAEQILGPFKFV